MINAVGRNIPEEVMAATGRDVFRGSYVNDNKEYVKAAPKVRGLCDPKRSKLIDSIHEAIVKCGVRDGMTLSFHHHFREGDYVLNTVMQEIHDMGIRDLTLCASSLGKANGAILPFIEDGTITSIYSSGVRGKIGEAISNGKLKNIAVMYSHGGRVRAIEEGRIHIDVAFIGAPTADEYGNLRAVGGKSDCGVLSYAYADAQYADRVVAVTDTLVPFPNIPASISMVNVDYVCVIDEIGNPAKIASGAAKPTTDLRKQMMAKYCSDFVAASPYFKDGFVYQTGVGGASIASTIYLAEEMRRSGIHMSLGLGGIATPMVRLMEEGLIDKLVDTQDFDLGAVQSIREHPDRHIEISGSEYANPMNKGAYVNKLDFVILAALEVDTHFNCNVITDSTGMITGAQGGHPDTAAGAKCTIVITPLIQGRSPAVCTDVTTVTTPGETVDVIVTDYGIAVNPARPDLFEAAEKCGAPVYTIEQLRDIAYSIVGVPEKIQFDERVVGIVEARDGTIMDVVRKRKEFTFD